MPPRSLFLVAALFVTGCGDPQPEPDPHAARLDELTQSVRELTEANAGLAKEVRRQSRELSRLSGHRLDRVRTPEASASPAVPESDDSETVAAADAPAAGDALPGDDAIPAEVADAVLASEAGKKAIAEATTREIERREEKDRRLFVSYEVGRFARQAGLDDGRTKKLQAIWKTSLDGGVELRKQFAAIGELPESEQADARRKAMGTMRDLGTKRRESVRALLDDGELTLYDAAEEKIVAGLHGAPRR